MDQKIRDELKRLCGDAFTPLAWVQPIAALIELGVRRGCEVDAAADLVLAQDHPGISARLALHLLDKIVEMFLLERLGLVDAPANIGVVGEIYVRFGMTRIKRDQHDIAVAEGLWHVAKLHYFV